MKSFKELYRDTIIQYRLEVGLISCAVIMLAIPVIRSRTKPTSPMKAPIYTHTSSLAPSNSLFKSGDIVIDIEGAVRKPGVYTMSPNSRTRDAIAVADGLTHDADTAYIAKRLNLSTTLRDQDKIYIPYLNDSDSTSAVIPQNSIVHINTSEIEQIDSLPRIGKTTALKIIQNRPYNAVSDLVDKHIVSKSVYEEIKQLIEL